MNRLGMVGVSFRRAGQEALARLTFAQEAREASCRRLHEDCQFEESVYLATCNRVEVVFSCRHGVPVSDYRERIRRFFANGQETSPGADVDRKVFHAYEKEGAAEHLFCVASSLDSMNPGESQILAQVRDAFRQAEGAGRVGVRLRLLFEEAFRSARRVRRETGLGRQGLSMASLAAGLIEERLTDDGRCRLVLVGRGEMIRECAKSFRGQRDLELLFVNRTLDGARELACEFAGRALSLEDFLARPESCQALVTSTSSPDPLFTSEVLERLVAVADVAPLLVDLAVPRDIDPAAARSVGCDLHDIDRLRVESERLGRDREVRLATARVLVDRGLETLRWRMVDREIGPVIAALQRRYRLTVEERLHKILSRSGSPVPGDEDLRILADSLARRFAHVPVLGLKKVAFDLGIEAVESFLSGLDGELGRELRARVREAPLHAPSRDGEEPA
jgi:glutamyl-tRNA reductase